MATKTAKKIGSTVDRPDAEQRANDHIARMEAAPATPPAKMITLPPMDIRTMRVPIFGDTSLIVNHWSEKAIKKIRDKQTGAASSGRENKDPEADFQASLYPYPGGGYGFPAIAFKKAAVEACTSLGKAVTKVAARQAFHIVGKEGLVKIEGTPRMREDAVTVGIDSADLRYRGEFVEWSAVLEVRYNARVMSESEIVNLIRLGGFAVGVGEWRVEKDGEHGLFSVGERI